MYEISYDLIDDDDDYDDDDDADKSLTRPFKHLYLIRTPAISIRIYQPYLASSKNTPQEVSVDVI